MAKKAPKSKRSLTATTSASDANNRTRAMAEKKKALKLKSPVKTKRVAQERRVSEKARNPISAKKSKVKPKKKSKREDVNKPKKPPTAFFFFLEDFRKEYQEQNPDVKSMRDIGKACGEKWKTMTYEEKVNYYDVATEKRAEFDKAMADYIKKKESGEDQEYEEDSEFDE